MLACHTAVTECTLDSSLNDEANPFLFADIRDGLQAMSSVLNLTHDKEDSLCKGKRQQTPSLLPFLTVMIDSQLTKTSVAGIVLCMIYS
jgi:hypothetical protein